MTCEGYLNPDMPVKSLFDDFIKYLAKVLNTKEKGVSIK